MNETIPEADLKAFNDAMVAIYGNAKKYCSYNASIYWSMLNDRGPLETAHYLLTTENPSDGFAKLWECGRLDLAVEYVALNPRWSTYLFSPEELATARERLVAHGMPAAKLPS